MFMKQMVIKYVKTLNYIHLNEFLIGHIGEKYK